MGEPPFAWHKTSNMPLSNEEDVEDKNWLLALGL